MNLQKNKLTHANKSMDIFLRSLFSTLNYNFSSTLMIQSFSCFSVDTLWIYCKNIMVNSSFTLLIFNIKNKTKATTLIKAFLSLRNKTQQITRWIHGTSLKKRALTRQVWNNITNLSLKICPWICYSKQSNFCDNSSL